MIELNTQNHVKDIVNNNVLYNVSNNVRVNVAENVTDYVFFNVTDYVWHKTYYGIRLNVIDNICLDLHNHTKLNDKTKHKK